MTRREELKTIAKQTAKELLSLAREDHEWEVILKTILQVEREARRATLEEVKFAVDEIRRDHRAFTGYYFTIWLNAQLEQQAEVTYDEAE